MVGHAARVCLGGMLPVVVVVFVFVVVIFIAIMVVVVGDARGSEMHWLTSFHRRGWWATQLGSASAVAIPPSSSPLPWW